MRRLTFLAIVLLLTTQVWALPNTPGANTALQVQPYENAFGNSASFVSAMTAMGYVITEARTNPGETAPAFGVDDYRTYLGRGFGFFWIEGHGNSGGHGVEIYYSNDIGLNNRNLAYNHYVQDLGYTAQQIYCGTSADGHSIGVRAAAITSWFTSDATAVVNKTCSSNLYASSWGSSWVHIGFAADLVSDETAFFTALEAGSTFTNAKDGLMVLSGTGDTILATQVASTNFDFMDLIPEGGLDIQWTFTGATTGSIYISSGPGIVCSQCWDGDVFNARICPNGNGAVWIRGAFCSINGVPLLHPTSTWGLSSGTNGAADVHFSVEGQTAKWLVGSEYRTEAYYVESAQTMEGPWERVGIEQGPGFTEYQLDISDALSRGQEWFRLCEREENQNGDTIPPHIIIHGYAQPTIPLARPAMQVQPRTLEFFEQAIADQQAARDRGDFIPVLPANVGDGKTMVCYTVAQFAAAVEQHYASYWRQFGYTVIVDVVPGFPQTPEEEDSQIAYLQSRIALHTAEGARYHVIWGDDNDYFYFIGQRWPMYWTGPWVPIRQQMLARYQAQLDHVVIPGITVRDDLPREENLAWWWPYYRNDKPYELPGTVVRRVPVTELWQIAAHSLVVQETNDYWSPSSSQGVGLFVGDMDHMRPNDGAIAKASADTVRSFLQSHGCWTSEVKESMYPNPELRNMICAEQWNGNINGHTNLNVMFATMSGPHYPGNMFSKRELGDYVWTMDLVWPFMNHHPFFIGATCGTAAIAPTDDAVYYHTPVVEDMLFHEAGAVGFYGPSCGSMLSSNKVIGYHVTAKILEDPMRPISDSITLAEEEMAVLYANRPWVLRQLNTMAKIGCPLSRLGPVMVPVGVGDEVPNQTSLAQNFPNPFNPKTAIRFATTREDHVSLKVFNVRGGLVATLIDGPITSGQHQIFWNGTDATGQRVASGTYFYRLEAEGRSVTRKMLLLK